MNLQVYDTTCDSGSGVRGNVDFARTPGEPSVARVCHSQGADVLCSNWLVNHLIPV